ncbi:MAG: hypothetical protein ABSF90_23955 [Syntrophobacteraceae bacterium]|jgi:hypothetical protein
MKPQVFTILLFRAKPGDLNIPDVPIPDQGSTENERLVRTRLENHFSDPGTAPQKNLITHA